jgi:hypothetical protein
VEQQLGVWFKELATGVEYEYTGEAIAQFCGNLPIAELRDRDGNEKNAALYGFYDEYKEITTEGAE